MQLVASKAFLPELFLSVSIVFLLVLNAWTVNNFKFNFPTLEKELFSQVLFILFCTFAVACNVHIEGQLYGMLFVSDFSSISIRLFLLFSCLFSFSIIWRSFILQKINFFEYFILYLVSVLSSLLLVSAYDFLSIYLVLEMQSIGFYILASFCRGSSFSSEAGLKYFISSTIMSGLFLFGCSIIYGCLGTLNLGSISLLLSLPLGDTFEHLTYPLLAGIFCITIVFLFKLSVAPFQFWFPQIYDGSPLSSTILFSVLPKIVMFTVFIRWLLSLYIFSFFLKPVLALIGLYSTGFGTFLALKQRRLKKLFIYSSIGQIGLPIAALSLMTADGVAAIFYFLFIYVITTILMWGFYVHLNVMKSTMSSNLSGGPIFISAISNMFTYNKIWALTLVVVFFSMAGIPPLSGFLAKIVVYLSLIQSGLYEVAAGLVLIGVYAVFYYIKILKVAFFENKAAEARSGSDTSLFFSPYYSIDCLIYSFFLYLLFALFFYPTLPLLLGNSVAYGFFGS